MILFLTGQTSLALAESVHTRLQAGIGYHFSSGDYGESRTTDITYVPLVVRGERGPWTLEVTLPYIEIRGPAGITSVVDDSVIEKSSTERGIGDIFASGTYTWAPTAAWAPYLDLDVSLKVPTADENDRLGTGEYDLATSIEAAWSLGRLSPFASFGYEFLGDPGETNTTDAESGAETVTGFDLNDAARASAGLSIHLVPDLYVGAYFDYGAPTSRGSGDRMDIVPYAMWRFSGPWMLQAYGSTGLASGSADWGAGGQVSYAWSPAAARD